MSLGVDYVYLPDYMLPTYFNTQIYHIVADPRICELVREVQGNRLFKLHKTKRDINTKLVSTENAGLLLKGHDGNYTLGWAGYNDSEGYKAGNWHLENDEEGRYVLTIQNNNKMKTYLYSFPGTLDLPPTNSFYRSLIEPATTYHFSADVKGEGMLKVYLIYYPHSRGMWTPLWESVLTEKYKSIENQFITPANTREYRLAFLLKGRGQLSLSGFTLKKIYNNYDMELNNQDGPETKSGEVYRGMKYDKHAAFSWSSRVKGQFLTLRNGLTTQSHNQEDAVSLRQPDSGECWLYTGKGPYIKPPSFYSDDNFHVGKPGSSSFRITASLKGKGYFDLYVIWYDKNGQNNKQYLDRYFLQNDYRILNKVITIPEEAREFRIAFRLREINNFKLTAKKIQKVVYRLGGSDSLWNTKESPSTLYVDELTIETYN